MERLVREQLETLSVEELDTLHQLVHQSIVETQKYYQLIHDVREAAERRRQSQVIAPAGIPSASKVGDIGGSE